MNLTKTLVGGSKLGYSRPILRLRKTYKTGTLVSLHVKSGCSDY